MCNVIVGFGNRLSGCAVVPRSTHKYTTHPKSKTQSQYFLYSFVLLQYTVHMEGNIASNEHLMKNDLEAPRVDDVEG
jgi:hypothetical protein